MEEQHYGPPKPTGPHINAEGKFQSDKYPTTPAGFVPLKTSDKSAQDLLFTYALRRHCIDPEFADDLVQVLACEGYQPAVDALRTRKAGV